VATLNERSKQARLEKQRIRRRIAFIVGAVVGVAAIICAVLFVMEAIRTKTYTGYETLNSYERNDSNTVQYKYYKGNLLKYSRDGASGIDDSGNAFWNGSYDMKEPIIADCGEYVAVADMGGKEVYVFNGKDAGTTVLMTYPIADLKVAGQGVVAVVLEDNASNIIQLYDPYATGEKLLAEIPTNVADDGYPVDIALSKDGKSIITSYINVNGGSLCSNVCFYNFSEVGQDKNRMVGGSPYDDKLVSKLEFCGNDTVCIMFDKGFAIYSNMKQPKLVHEEFFEEEIVSVVNSDMYVGFVFAKASEDGNYNMIVYDLKGNKVLEKSISGQYENINIYGDEIILYNDMSCKIIRIDGSEKFNYTFEAGIEYFIKADGKNNYYIIDSTYVNKVRLTEDK